MSTINQTGQPSGILTTPESDWKSSSGTYRKTGVELNKDVTTFGGTYSIRYGYDSEKLELHEHSTAYSWLISSANTGVGTTRDLHLFFF